MEIICINNDNTFMGRKWELLTLKKPYLVLSEEDDMYKIIDDSGEEEYYGKRLFEVIEKKIEFDTNELKKIFYALEYKIRKNEQIAWENKEYGRGSVSEEILSENPILIKIQNKIKETYPSLI